VKVAIGVGSADSNADDGFERVVHYAVEAEKRGVDCAWTAEAWGMDAVAPLAFLAARTSRLHLGTGIMQISARTPAVTAMTALTMAAISGDRFRLGLGASGPQVVEGLHSRSFSRPLERMRENIEIIRMAFRGEMLEYQGRQYQLPLPGGEGKSLRLSHGPRPHLPIYLATLAPKALELTGELADGWLGTSFIPEHADAHLAHIERGARKAGRSLKDLDLQVGGMVAITSDPEPLIERRKHAMAFTLGAMGSARTNYYNAAFQRAGLEDVAREVQALWIDGKRKQAATRVPTDLILQTSLIGSEEWVRSRIRAYRDAGITTLRVDPHGKDPGERLETLERAVELVADECGTGPD